MSYKTPMLRGRVGHTVYPYMFTPKQLLFIANQAELASEKHKNGAFVEAGCAYGATTVFLNKLLDSIAHTGKYYTVDTFSGFTESSIDYEVAHRGKPGDFEFAFVVNKQEWFDATMQFHNISRVKSFKHDVATFDFKSLEPLAFCLLDVDLYQPSIEALPKIYNSLLPGGVIIIDDCMKNHIYDGAEAAYSEFCKSENIPYDVREGKLGIIVKK